MDIPTDLQSLALWERTVLAVLPGLLPNPDRHNARELEALDVAAVERAAHLAGMVVDARIQMGERLDASRHEAAIALEKANP